MMQCRGFAILPRRVCESSRRVCGEFATSSRKSADGYTQVRDKFAISSRQVGGKRKAREPPSAEQELEAAVSAVNVAVAASDAEAAAFQAAQRRWQRASDRLDALPRDLGHRMWLRRSDHLIARMRTECDAMHALGERVSALSEAVEEAAHVAERLGQQVMAEAARAAAQARDRQAAADAALEAAVAREWDAMCEEHPAMQEAARIAPSLREAWIRDQVAVAIASHSDED